MFLHRTRRGAGGARSGGRWAGLGAAALTGAACLVSVPAASAAGCPEAQVIFARGTNEPPGIGRVGQSFVDSLRQQADGLDIGTYPVNYNASSLQIHTGDGANDVISHVKSMASSCPATKLVLGGYSQGADVIDIVSGAPIGGITWGSSLPAEYARTVAAVAVFGDVASRSGRSLAARSPLFGTKVIDLCNPVDPICHAGPGNEWTGHSEGYVPVYTTQAAAFVASKLLAGTGRQVPGFGPQAPGLAPRAPGGSPQAPGPQPPAGPLPPGSGPSIHGPMPAPPLPSSPPRLVSVVD